ncbi:MAG: hypothetical protein WA875_08340 [Candidatus Acidiferrales bacterium]
MEIVSSAELTIAYDGEILRRGSMDVQELAPALMATASLLQKANDIANGDRTHVNLRVKSEFRRGSFLVNLVVDQGLLEQAKTFLQQYPNIKEAKDILEIVFFYAGIPISLFKLIKKIGEKKPDSVEFQDNGDTVVLAIGNEKVTVNKNTYNLYLDPDARKAASRIVEPLNTEGIDSLEIRRGEEIERVGKEDAQAFSYFVPETEVLLDSVAEAWLSIITLSFSQGYKWRFFTGGTTILATIVDESFWKDVHKQEVKFSEGDQLLVNLRTTTSRDEAGELRSRYSVEKVLKHVAGPKQTRLDLE